MAAQNGQPGNTGSPRLLHTPKKSILRPRGSKAQVAELAPGADLPAPAAKLAARSVGFRDESQSTAASAKAKGTSFAGMSGDSPTSSRPGTQTYKNYESQVKAPPIRTALPSGTGSNEYIRGTSIQDSPLTPKSPTALQAKLQRLKAKWSTLAGHVPSLSDSDDAFRPARAAGHAPSEHSTAVNVTASAPFTIIQLDREESAGLDGLPGNSGITTAPDQVASAREEANPSSSSAIHRAKTASAHGSPRDDNADSEPVRSAWEEALGLPAGVDLWGPTVVELPDSNSTTELHGNTKSHQASTTRQADILYVTAPRPVAEAVETESFDESSQLTSPTTATLSMTEMRSPGSHTETESVLNVRGNSAYEDQASTVSSSNLTPSTLTLETASVTIAESPGHHPMKNACGEEPVRVEVVNPDTTQGTAGAVPPERHQRLTLDQVLSTERATPPRDALDNSHPHAVQQQSSAGRMLGQMQGSSAREPGLDLGVTQPAAAATAAREGADTSGNSNVPPSSIEQDAVGMDPHARDPVGLGFTIPEPAALDRGEPTFEEKMRLQETKGTGRRGVQLLSSRKQALPGQRAGGSGSPQRSFSPFGRLGCLPRSHSQEDYMPMPSARDIETSSNKPQQAAESASGPGPLETGIHQVELGGYYLTTPDPLRTDPGIALRRRTSSEQSGQSAAQHAQHVSDPLNGDPVQYVSSPSWRMNALSALDKLQPSLEPAAASDSEAWQTLPRPEPSPASKQVEAQKACSQYRLEYIGDRSDVRDATWSDRRSRERRDAEGSASGHYGKAPPGFARVQDGPGKEGSSRDHVKKEKLKGSLEKRRTHRHMAGGDAHPSMSEVSSWQAAFLLLCCHTIR